jgi:hypothetical protein
MTHIIDQNRVSLRNLAVADFASEETLCFSTTVLLDGQPIAEAKNDGHGGCTFIRALKGAHAKLAEAEAFAKSLPPVEIPHDDPSRNFTIDVTLDYLVDLLASQIHSDRKVRAAFKRDIANKVLYVKDDELLYLKGVRLKAVNDRSALFAQLRAKHGADLIILAELPPDEGFDLWRRYVLQEGRS